MSISLKTRRSGRVSDSDPIDWPVSFELEGLVLEFFVVNSHHVRLHVTGRYRKVMKETNSAIYEFCSRILADYLVSHHSFLSVDSDSVEDSVFIWPSDKGVVEAMLSEIGIDSSEYANDDYADVYWDYEDIPAYWHIAYKSESTIRYPWFFHCYNGLSDAVDDGIYEVS